MKAFITAKPEVPIVSHLKPNGVLWTLKEKLWLGLSKEDYKAQFIRNPVNWVLIFIFAIGIPIILQRYIFGLGSITHASNDYPWGLFLGFGLFGMVPLSASGFLLGTTVEIFGRKDLHLSHKMHLRFFVKQVDRIADEAEDVADRLNIYVIKRML